MQATASTGRRRAAARPERPARAEPRPPWFRVVPEDGWLTLSLTALLVYVTVWSIQSVNPPWAPGLQILSTVTGVGLLLAYVSVQQGRVPGVVVHTAALALGVTFAFLQTDDVSLGGNRRALFDHVGVWFRHALLANGSSNDNAIFLLFLSVLTALLAYISVWLVVRTRRPWLAAMANGVVLLINLNWSTPDHYVFLAFFLLVALILLVRFNLADNMRRWRAIGLRFSPDLSWDFMQAGALFAVLVLLLAYNLPVGTASPAVLNALTSPHSPLSALQVRLTQLFGGLSGKKGPGQGVGFFGGSLKLVGTVNLPNTVFLHYSVPSLGDDFTQYLVTETYDTYDNNSLWTQSSTTAQHYDTSALEPPPSNSTIIDTYQISLDQTPTGGEYFLFAPGTVPASFSVPTTAEVSTQAQVPSSWLAVSALGAGDNYVARGYLPTATIAQLEQVPYPNSPQLSVAERNTLYPPDLLQQYLPNEATQFSPLLIEKAREWTKGATNMYQAAEMLQDSLHTFTYSATNPDPPSGEDAMTWFMTRQEGFCTFFASAMALMGRSLGMPTRIVSGFTNGSYDSRHNDFVVRESQAHTWTQIYFAQYGWVNFEPTSSFNPFARGVTTTTGPSATPTPTGTGSTGSVTPTPRFRGEPFGPSTSTGPTSTSSAPLIDAGLGTAGAIFLLLLVVIAFLTWWRLLYRRLSPAAAAFARVSRLGAWAGAPPARSQTPDEYTERLSRLAPGQRSALRELGDVYDRERWGGGPPGAAMHTLGALYAQIRGALTPLILHRVRRLPLSVLRRLRRRSVDVDR
jgi:transglutaminase-like putative cysteine protease